MRVRFTGRSRGDLIAILDYVQKRSPQGASNIRRAIKQAIRAIGEHPQIGRVAGEQGTRVLPAGRYPYLIYWSIEAGEVWVVHIRHAARRPWKHGGEE